MHFSLKRHIHYLVAEIISNVKKCIFRDIIKKANMFFLNKSVVMFHHNLFNRKVFKICWQSKQLTCRTVTCRTDINAKQKRVWKWVCVGLYNKYCTSINQAIYLCKYLNHGVWGLLLVWVCLFGFFNGEEILP